MDTLLFMYINRPKLSMLFVFCQDTSDVWPRLRGGVYQFKMPCPAYGDNVRLITAGRSFIGIITAKFGRDNRIKLTGDDYLRNTYG